MSGMKSKGLACRRNSLQSVAAAGPDRACPVAWTDEVREDHPTGKLGEIRVINVLSFVRGPRLLWLFVAWAIALAAPAQSQGTKATEMAEIISHVRATGKSDNKKFIYPFFAKALGLGNADIPGVKRRGGSFGEDPRVYLFDMADQPSGTILLMYKYDPASGTIVWRVSPAGNV